VRGIGLVRGSIAVALAATLLSACSAPPDLTTEAAEELQAAVGEVVQASAQGQYEAARSAATEARTLLEEAAEAGQVSADRYRLIDEALTRTEQELTALLTAAGTEPSADASPTAEPEQVAEPDPGPGSGDDEPPGGPSRGGPPSDSTGPPDHSNAGGKDK